MPRLSVLVAAIAAMLAGCTQPLPPPSEAQVQEFVRQYVAAANAGEASKVMSMVSKETGVTSAVYGEVLRGWEEIRKHVDANISAAATTKITVATVSVAPLGPDTALAVAPFTITTNLQRQPVELAGAMSIVVQRADQSLHVVHEHYSLRVQ